MRGNRNGLVTIACGGMLLSWLYAWSTFLTSILDTPPFPLFDSALILIASVFISMFHGRRGWRVISIIVLQTGSFSLVFLHMICRQFGYSLWSNDWFTEPISNQYSILEWTIVVIIFLYLLGLWIGGIKLTNKSSDPFNIGSRFDLGTAAFFFLLIIQLVMIGKGITIKNIANCEMNFLAFFVFGFLSLGMARYDRSIERDFMGRYRGVGVVLSFMLLVFLFGGGLIILFLPSLMSAAELGQDLLKTVARPALPIIINVIRFVFIKGCSMGAENADQEGLSGTGSFLSNPDTSEHGIFWGIVIWVLIVSGGIILMIMLSFAAWYLILWLASKRSANGNRRGIWASLIKLTFLFKSLVASVFEIIKKKPQNSQGPGNLFETLQRWGSNCGLPKLSVETPSEYGSRLIGQFPILKNEISLIIDLFNQKVYGDIDPEERRYAEARLACHRLRSPFLWPSRFKKWFLPTGG